MFEQVLFLNVHNRLNAGTVGIKGQAITRQQHVKVHHHLIMSRSVVFLLVLLVLVAVVCEQANAQYYYGGYWPYSYG